MDTGKNLAEQIAALAYKERMKNAEKQKTMRVLVVCLSALLAAAIICGTIIAMKAIDGDTSPSPHSAKPWSGVVM